MTVRGPLSKLASKVPDWLVVDGIKPSDVNDDGTVTVTYHVRLWHPGFWLACAAVVVRKLVKR